jgi:hypothetical protein
MELGIRIQIEESPEGVYVATSDELQGLAAQAGPLPRPSTSLATSPGS